METWYELKARTDKTDAEKIVVVCVEAIHKSKTMETESEEKTYNTLCARVGAEVPDLITPENAEELAGEVLKVIDEENSEGDGETEPDEETKE